MLYINDFSYFIHIIIIITPSFMASLSLSSRYYSHFSVVNYYVQGIFHVNKKNTFLKNLNILITIYQ